MAKDKKRIDARAGSSSDRPIKSGVPAAVPDDLLRFSFKFFDADHPEFHCKDREAEYHQKLLERIKELSREKVSSLTNRKSDRVLRFHRIDFGDARVSQTGFGIGGWEEYDEDARQFSLSKAEHGRVHGFLIENVFYVVRLDQRHRLYPRG